MRLPPINRAMRGVNALHPVWHGEPAWREVLLRVRGAARTLLTPSSEAATDGRHLLAQLGSPPLLERLNALTAAQPTDDPPASRANTEATAQISSDAG